MNTDQIFFLGLRRSVLAISKVDGRVLWATKLPAGMSHEFVTIACDGSKVFAYCSGHLHALDINNGAVLWSNSLPGYGYGLGTICFPGGSSSPEAAVQSQFRQRAAASA